MIARKSLSVILGGEDVDDLVINIVSVGAFGVFMLDYFVHAYIIPSNPQGILSNILYPA